jgi:LysM repeat protein
MSLGNWGQNFLKDAAGAFFGSDYLRDYTHASKTFRTNSYQNAPKLKFLFHTYFETNAEAFPNNFNYGLLVKDVKLPSFTFATHQMNQYNRKRIVQTKIKYEAVDITFHDDNNDSVNYLWNNYYQYYFSDGSKPQNVLQGFRGTNLDNTPVADAGLSNRSMQYNDRNLYENSITGDDDWGFSGGQTNSDTGKKVAFFKNITVFGFNQHNFTAYTFINPVVTNFSHDSYNYEDGNGVMQNKMTIDYETVVYNYGKMDGRKPGDIVTGFGDVSTYDRTVSPIAQPGSNGTVLGQGGLVDAAGGAMRALGDGDILSAVKTVGTTYNTFKNTNLKSVATAELNAMLRNSIQNTPNTRNSLFNFPKAGATPGPIGTAAFPTIGARSSPPVITDLGTAGNQYNGADLTEDTPVRQSGGGNLPISQSYYDALQRINVDSVRTVTDVDLDALNASVLATLGDIPVPPSGIDNPFAKDYKIKKGDNLTKIAKANGTTVQALLKANPNIKNPNLIYAGESIRIPTNVPKVIPGQNNTDKDAFSQNDFIDDPQAAETAELFDAEFGEDIDDGTTDLEDPDFNDPFFT